MIASGRKWEGKKWEMRYENARRVSFVYILTCMASIGEASGLPCVVPLGLH